VVVVAGVGLLSGGVLVGGGEGIGEDGAGDSVCVVNNGGNDVDAFHFLVEIVLRVGGCSVDERRV
jgi:hypothetical protein